MENKIRKRQNNGKQRDINCGLQNGSMQIKSDKSCYCRSSNNLHEFNCHFVPKHLKFNEYVHTGYRVDLSTWKCLKSLFYLHNESFNVYSHGLAAIALVLLSPYYYSSNKINLLWLDPFIYPVHHITSVTCVLFSSVFHLMMCHCDGKKAYLRFITLDYLGIWLVTGLSCITFLKATFFCYPQMLFLFAAMYFTFGFVSFLFVLRGTNAATRIRPLVVLGALRVLVVYPTRLLMTSWGYTSGPLGTIWYMLGVEMVGVISAILNLAHLPEKWFRGRFDYFLSSHNIMHLVALIAPALLHCGTVMDFQWMQKEKCLA